MAYTSREKSMFMGVLIFFELIFHSVVREVRTQSGSAIFGIFKEVANMGMFMLMFFLIYTFMGRSFAIRGDFMMFLLTGVGLMVIHMRAIGSVRSASNATSAIMQHAPMTVILSIISNAFAGLYLQCVAAIIIFLVLWVFGMDTSVQDPKGLLLPVFFAWASGISVGLVFMMISPLAPAAMKTFTQLYMRAQMITSGKFIPAGYLPASLIGYFDWNPLFHCIDQARLTTFVNYNKEVSSMSYAIWFTLFFLLLGLMGEFWSRKNLSKSRHS